MRKPSEQIAKTESLFRNVNERIAEASQRFDSGDNGDGAFMCECADPACAERLEVPLDEYEEIRDDATTFMLDPDHVEPEIETVIQRRRGYAVVKKVDAAAERIVRKLDPRANPI
jgi:hypothetical protein